MRAYERLLKYISVWTTSDENSETVPSSGIQFDLAKVLVEEMKELGIENAMVDDKCYIYGSIPATEGYEEKPSIALIAHMDTSPECSGQNVCPQIIENYDGQDVVLGESGLTLKVSDFPHLSGLKGRTLITTDGTTLLGADDKAGIAEALTVVEEILASGEAHGKICICFTPDEEIGRGADHVDVKRVGADYGYTLDGGKEGEIECENFNASTGIFTVTGVSTHTGSAKGTLVNAQTLAMEIHSMIPVSERPETTEKYEGFYHLNNMSGNVSKATLKYLIRDFESDGLKARESFMRSIADKMNEKYGEGVVKIEIIPSYRNMKEMIEPCYHLIENAIAATKAAGVEPEVTAIRGGTDGATLSYMGLPCPNLGTGGYAYHGALEHITVEGMDKAVEIVKDILRRYAA